VLPDREPFLCQVDEGLARPERLAAVGRPDRRDESGITDREWANPMGDREREDLEAGDDVLGHLAKYACGARMTLVMQRGHGSAMIVVPDISAERHNGANSSIADEPVQRIEVEGAFGHID